MIELTVHSIGNGVSALSEKEGEGATVSFRDGTLFEAFLTTKDLFQLIKLKLGQKKAVAPRLAQPVGNGNPQ
jgi:hypothetical protein